MIMKKMLNNKGFAIETVLVAIVTFYALCFLMTAYALGSKKISNVESSKIEYRLFLDSIGEDYINHIISSDSFDYDGYDYVNDKVTISFTIETDETNEYVDKHYLIVREDSNIVLSIEFTYDTELNVLRWTYSE